MKTSWQYLPECLRKQARNMWCTCAPGDGFTYHWVALQPPAEYCGPMPFGKLLRRSRSNNQ